jgi:hypothetical protein
MEKTSFEMNIGFKSTYRSKCYLRGLAAGGG